MARFRYRMQNILELDEKLEEQQKAAFSLANMRLQEEQAKLQQLLLRKASYERKIKEYATGIVNITEIHHAKEGVRATEFAIRDQMAVIRRAQRQVDIERAKLNEAMRDRKTQEKLKEKAFAVFLKELADEEIKVTDELISYKYGTNAKAAKEE